MIYKLELILSVKHKSNIIHDLLLFEEICSRLEGEVIVDENDNDAILMTIEDAGVFNLKTHFINK